MRARPRLDAIWSMIPTGAPTKSFSARCADLREVARRRVRGRRRCAARAAAATSSAALDDSPPPSGTSDSIAQRRSRRSVDRVPRSAAGDALHVVDPVAAAALRRPARNADRLAASGDVARSRRGRGRRRAAPARRASRCGDRDRQHEAAVVVGVLADQVDAARAPRATTLGARPNSAAKLGGSLSQRHLAPPQLARLLLRAACRP